MILTWNVKVVIIKVSDEYEERVSGANSLIVFITCKSDLPSSHTASSKKDPLKSEFVKLGACKSVKTLTTQKSFSLPRQLTLSKSYTLRCLLPVFLCHKLVAVTVLSADIS